MQRWPGGVANVIAVENRVTGQDSVRNVTTIGRVELSGIRETGRGVDALDRTAQRALTPEEEVEAHGRTDAETTVRHVEAAAVERDLAVNAVSVLSVKRWATVLLNVQTVVLLKSVAGEANGTCERIAPISSGKPTQSRSRLTPRISTIGTELVLFPTFA